MLNKVLLWSIYLLTDSSATAVHDSRKFVRCMAQLLFFFKKKKFDSNAEVIWGKPYAANVNW